MKNFSELGRKEIRKELSDGIVIYNPSPEQKKKILEILTNNAQGSDIRISGETILLELIPLLTNLKFDLDREKDKVKIAEILDDPDELLEEIVREIKTITKKISKNTIDIINDLNETPKEQVIKLIEEYNEEKNKTDKDKEIEELEKKLAELKNK